jgi:hypothetical protein
MTVVEGELFSVFELPIKKEQVEARCWWLTPIILATQEAEIRGIEV